MRSALVIAVLAPSSAFAGSAVDFFSTAGQAEIEETVSVPLQRGVDTKGRPAVFASGPKGDGSDEFLLTLNFANGTSKCTEAVVGALGGTKTEKTVSRSGKALGKITKTVVTMGEIPELRIGELVIKGWRCEVHKEENSLVLPTLDDVAVALLPSRGIVKFAPASQADALLTSVGTPVQATKVRGVKTWTHGSKKVTLGVGLLVPVTLFGQPAQAWLAPHEMSGVYRPFPGIGTTWMRSGAPYTFGPAEIGGVALSPATYAVYDTPFSVMEGQEVVAVLGADVLYATDIAMDPAGRVAVAPAGKVLWSNPGVRILEEKKKAFEKVDEADGGDDEDEAASILAPLPEGSGALATVAADPGPTCEFVAEVEQPSFAYVEGVRSFGAKARTVSMVEVCDEPPVAPRARRADSEPDASDDGGGTPEGEGGAEPEVAAGNQPAGKEATRQADWGDALWSQGRYDEAYVAFTAALADAGDDCSFYLDHAEKSLRMGKPDSAANSAARAAELYEAYMAYDLEVRLRTEQKKASGLDPTLVQAHDCHKARGIEAQAALARAEHAKVDAIYERYMDLDEDLALASALARLQRGWAATAQGPLLQALNVGARGQRPVYATTAMVAARTGNARMLDANLDRLFELDSAWTLSDAAVASAAAREAGGPSASLALTRRIAEENPTSASAWAIFGLEALRAGDTQAQAQVKQAAAKLAEAEVAREAGNGNAWCRAAALQAVTGDVAGAEAAWKEAQVAAGRGMDCITSRAVAAAAAGDSTALAGHLTDLARRFPAHPLGTLSALAPVGAR